MKKKMKWGKEKVKLEDFFHLLKLCSVTSLSSLVEAIDFFRLIDCLSPDQSIRSVISVEAAVCRRPSCDVP